MPEPRAARSTRFDSIKTHVIRGKRFLMRWRRPPGKGRKTTADDAESYKNRNIVYGQCDCPSDKKPVMYISPEGSTRDDLALLMTTVHEVLHASCFDLDETVVEEYEASLMELLIRMGISVNFLGAGQRPKAK